MDIKVIYWDLGGVCVTDNVRPAFESYGVEYGQQQKSAWRERRRGEISSDEFFREATKGTILESRVNELQRQMKKLIILQPDGALPVISAVNSLGIYRQGVISNHVTEWVRYMEERFKISSYFDPNLFIISEEVGLDKSDPDIFDLAHELSGVTEEEILFIDNDTKNVQKAREKSEKRKGLNADVFQNTKQISQVLREYGIRIGLI